MNRFLLTAWLLAFAGLANVAAQADYQPGYIVSAQGDTLRGSIDYRNWLRNPNAITFRSAGQGEGHTYKPLEIRALGVAGDVYESAIVQVDLSPIIVGELSETPEPQLETDTTFIRVLVSGEKSLYVYHTTNQRGNTEQYYIRNNGKWELLIYKKYIRKRTVASINEVTKDFVATNNRYISQLAFYLRECPTIQKKMRSLRYRGANLERLFQAYYQCTTTTPAYEQKPEKRPLEFGILAGAAQSSINFNVVGAFPATPVARTEFPSSVSFTGGVFLDIVRLRNNRKWSFNNELVYSSFAFDGTYYSQRTATSATYYRTKLEYSYIKLNTMIRFKYPIGKAYLFANAGVSGGAMLDGSDRQTQVTESPSIIKVSESKAFENGVESFDLGILGGLGFRYQRYAFETRFERTQGMINYIGMRAPITRVAFLLSFRLTK